MDAIVTAGGIPQPEEPLYPYTQGGPKALLDICGKPMIQWVLDALGGAKTIDHVVVIGLTADSGVTCAKPTVFIPTQGGMLDNIRSGVRKALELSPQFHHVIAVSSDIPAITPEIVDWAVEAAMQTDEDLYYNLITRQVMEARYPSSKRSYVRLKDVEVCGGDMNVLRTMTVTGNDELWERIVAARKNALKQAALVGYDTLILLLLRMLTLEGAVKRVVKRMNVTGRAILSPYAEVGMDVDKPHQLEIMRQDLARRA
ncbi:MAG: nucleotidyltransferase family protein [Anaerolineales bacterium]|nr:nucleotidyltransferase family protein [Anaerolineales bacterium]